MTDYGATEQNVPLAIAQMEIHREQLKNGTVPARLILIPFDKAAAQFLSHYQTEKREHPNTYKRTATSFVSLMQFFGQRALSSIGEADIEDFKQMRREREIKNPTLHNDLCNLSLLFQYGKKRNWNKANPVEEVEIPSVKDAVRINVLTPEMERSYFQEATRRSIDLADIATIMLTQGCRPEEVMNLQQSAIDLKSGWLRVLWGKTASAKRRLLMTRESYEVFQRRLEKPGKWVFPSPRNPGRPVANIYRAHEDVLSLFGPEMAFVPYDLRHTFATRFACAGCPLPTLARILGHSNLSCVFKYVHPSQAMMDDAMRVYSSTGELLPPPSLPMGANSFEDIAQPLSAEPNRFVINPFQPKPLQVVWSRAGRSTA